MKTIKPTPPNAKKSSIGGPKTIKQKINKAREEREKRKALAQKFKKKQ